MLFKLSFYSIFFGWLLLCSSQGFGECNSIINSKKNSSCNLLNPFINTNNFLPKYLDNPRKIENIFKAKTQNPKKLPTLDLQKKLYKLTNIYAFSREGAISSRILEAAINIFTNVIRLPKNFSFDKLRYIVSLKKFPDKKLQGLYIEKKSAIAIIEPTSDSLVEGIYETITHEIGHALLFSLLKPNDLVSFAGELGGWPLKPSLNLYDHQFFKKFSGINKLPSSFPSTYSYYNSHEWFAENFTQFALEKLGKKNNVDPKISHYFDELFRTL